MLPVSGRVGVGGAFRAGVCPLPPGRRQTLFLFEKHPVAGLRWQHLRVAEGWGPLGLGALLVPSLESGPGRLPTVKSATRVFQNPSPHPIWQWFLRVIHIRTHCKSTNSQPRTQADWIRLSRAGAWDLQPYSLAWRFTTQLGQISFSKERLIYTLTPVHLLFLWGNWHSSLLR